MVASPEDLHEFGVPRSVDELKMHSFMVVSGLFADGFAPLIRNGEKLAARVNVMWAVSHWRPLLALLLSGAGIGVLQVPAGIDVVMSGQLKRVLAEYEVRGFRLRMLYSRDVPLPTYVQSLVDFVRDELRSHVAQALAARNGRTDAYQAGDE
nr:LysR substrate-binding domain-containing protein [Rhizorhabdus wittichii]